MSHQIYTVCPLIFQLLIEYSLDKTFFGNSVDVNIVPAFQPPKQYQNLFWKEKLVIAKLHKTALGENPQSNTMKLKKYKIICDYGLHFSIQMFIFHS